MLADWAGCQVYLAKFLIDDGKWPILWRNLHFDCQGTSLGIFEEGTSHAYCLGCTPASLAPLHPGRPNHPVTVQTPPEYLGGLSY